MTARHILQTRYDRARSRGGKDAWPCRVKSKGAGAPRWCSSATYSRPWSAAASVATSGEVEAVLRRLDQIPTWISPLAFHLFARERRALAVAGTLGIAPALLFAGKRVLVRSWIDGVALHIAKPLRRRGLLPLRQGGAAQAASRRHLPQRSRQGAELAARARRQGLSHRFSARRLLQAPQRAVPARRL